MLFSPEDMEALGTIPIKTLVRLMPNPGDMFPRNMNLNHVVSERHGQPLGRKELTLAGDDVRNPVNTLIGQCLSMWLCGSDALDSLGNPVYVELAFRDEPTEKQAARHFFDKLPFQDAVTQKGVEALLARELQSVYIPAQIAHPRGHFIHQLISSPEKMKSLIVAFGGTQNPLMCPGCTSIWSENITDNREHILWPYHACRSIPGFMGGRCANCIWHGDESCPGRILMALQIKTRIQCAHGTSSKTSASTEDNQSSRYPAVQLNRTLSPRVTCDYPFRLGTDEIHVTENPTRDESHSANE